MAVRPNRQASWSNYCYLAECWRSTADSSFLNRYQARNWSWTLLLLLPRSWQLRRSRNRRFHSSNCYWKRICRRRGPCRTRHRTPSALTTFWDLFCDFSPPSPLSSSIPQEPSATRPPAWITRWHAATPLTRRNFDLIFLFSFWFLRIRPQPCFLGC